MAEISGIQLLACVVILAFFYLVFNIVQTNWSYKFEEREEVEEDRRELTAEEIRTEPAALPVIVFAREKEIRLVPQLLMEDEKAGEEPVSHEPARELVFTAETAEELYEFSRAQ
jgi:hypothetical protein